jgi:hypothetical protein
MAVHFGWDLSSSRKFIKGKGRHKISPLILSPHDIFGNDVITIVMYLHASRVPRIWVREWKNRKIVSVFRAIFWYFYASRPFLELRLDLSPNLLWIRPLSCLLMLRCLISGNSLRPRPLLKSCSFSRLLCSLFIFALQISRHSRISSKIQQEM